MLCSFMQKYCWIFFYSSWAIPRYLHEALQAQVMKKRFIYFCLKQSPKLWNIFRVLRNEPGDCTVGWEFCALGHPISSGRRLGLSNCVRTLQWVLTRVPLILQGFLKCHSHLEVKELPCWAPLTTNYFPTRKTTIESS